jgi:hypothetical protein
MNTPQSSETIETAFAQLSGVAFDKARDLALSSGQGVLQVESGALYRCFAEGRKEFIKKVAPSVRIDPSKPFKL